MKQRASLPILTTNGRSFSNTPLGRSISINSSFSTFRSNLLNNSSSNVSLKKIKSEPWQRLFEGKKQQNLSNSRNKLNNDALLDDDIINGQKSIEETLNSAFLPTAIQNHIDHLHEQVENLTALLSEERFKHKQTRINANDKFVSQLKSQETHFQELLQKQTIEYKNQLNEQEQKHAQFIDEQRIANLQREEELRQKFDFLKKAFHAYKINSDKGNVELLHTKIHEVLHVLTEESPETDGLFQQRMKQILVRERQLMSEKQRIEIENLKKQHKMEIDQLQRSLTNANQDKQRSETLDNELETTKIELRLSKELAINLTTQMKDLELQHIKTVRELNDYRARFNEKLHDFDKYRSEKVEN